MKYEFSIKHWSQAILFCWLIDQSIRIYEVNNKTILQIRHWMEEFPGNEKSRGNMLHTEYRNVIKWRATNSIYSPPLRTNCTLLLRVWFTILTFYWITIWAFFFRRNAPLNWTLMWPPYTNYSFRIVLPKLQEAIFRNFTIIWHDQKSPDWLGWD